jgi:hypothetical protein
MGRLLARRSIAVTVRFFVNSLENLRGAINTCRWRRRLTIGD